MNTRGNVTLCEHDTKERSLYLQKNCYIQSNGGEKTKCSAESKTI